MYVKIEDNQITQTTNNLRKEYPNTSLPQELPDEFDGWVKVVDTAPNPTGGQVVGGSNVELVEGIPQKVYTYRDQTPMEIIHALESQVTPRRIRDAILGTDNGWLANQEALIAVERSKL